MGDYRQAYDRSMDDPVKKEDPEGDLISGYDDPGVLDALRPILR